MALAIALHILSAVIWVGGMSFAYVCLRPVTAKVLEPPHRLTLWRNVFKNFFKIVFVCIIVLLLSGHYMLTLYGGMKGAGLHIHIMMTLAYIMFAIFLHLFFAPFKRFSQAVETQNWPIGAQHLNSIRRLIGINLVLGLFIIIIASAGRFILL